MISSSLEGRVIILRMDPGFYYHMDEIGSAIWDALAEPQPVASLCDRLRREFDVDPETCRSDVTAYLAELVTEDLVVLDP